MDLWQEMSAEMRDILGSGYVPEYYRSLASGFVSIANRYAEEQVAEALGVVQTFDMLPPARDPQAWSVLAEGLDGEAGMKR